MMRPQPLTRGPTSRPPSRMSDDPTRLDLHDLHAAYAAGRFEPVAVLRAHLARMDALAPSLRCLITRMDTLAWAQARASAARWAAGRPIGLLDGIPVGLKDNIAVAGVACTAGTAALRAWVPGCDAAVVTRLRDAGAVLVAKLNLHEAALGATTANPVFGDCQNPRRAGYTPGGSSGGSAAAVAAGLCTVALGTDTMGSVRIPAAYCGLYGHKPALGDVPLDGIVPLSPTLDTCGALARSARDAMAVAAVLGGRPAFATARSDGVRDATDWPLGGTGIPVGLDVQAILDCVPNGLAPPSGRPWRIGLPTQVEVASLQAPVAAVWHATQQALTRVGARLAPVEVPAWQPPALRRAALLLSEMEGHAWWAPRLGEGLPGLSAELQAMLRFPSTLATERRERARAMVAAVRLQAARVFDEFDLLLLPTTPQAAFPHGAPVPPDQGDWTTLANVMGCAALSFPVAPPGATVDDLPVGCQLLGPGFAMRDGSVHTLEAAKAALQGPEGDAAVASGHAR